jgi:Asp-tRNA(Asn)/Glu-tRNA(Gln) amidotransferase A subunit family amidase
MIRPVVPANLIGLPSACVPAGLDPATGLPIGVLLTGRRMHDMECLDAAEAIEASFRLPTPIRNRRERPHIASGDTPKSQRCRPPSSNA